MTKKLSALDCVKSAIARTLIDFHQWCSADTQAGNYWKKLDPKDAFKVAPGRMIDDTESMLAKYRQQDFKTGQGSPFPVMLLAVQSMVSPPDIDTLQGQSDWRDVIIPSDPKQRRVKLRTTPRQYRVQLAFVSADDDTSQGIINDFCNYMRSQEKRRFLAEYHLGDGVKDQWDLTVIENSLMPDKVDTGQTNLFVNIVDFEIIGLLPVVIGLSEDDKNIDPKSRDTTAQGEWSSIEEVDVYGKSQEHTHIRVTVQNTAVLSDE